MSSGKMLIYVDIQGFSIDFEPLLQREDFFMAQDKNTGVACKSDTHHCWFAQRSYKFETQDAAGNVTSNETQDDWKKRVINELATPAGMTAIGLSKTYLIFHDKDVDEHGDPKGLHCHFVVWFKHADIWERVHKKLGCSDREQNCVSPSNQTEALRYLIHVSAKALNTEKYIYPAENVIAVSANNNPILPYRKAIIESKNSQIKQKQQSEREAKAAIKAAKSEMLEKVATGELTLPQVRSMYKTDAMHVGTKLCDWYTDRNRFVLAEQERFDDMLNFYSVNPRCLTTVYISGVGGLGKSELGLALANSCFPGRPIHRPATHGEQTTFDFAGDYHGEPVTLFNEFSACFPVDQFNDIFDPIHANRVNSRNKDKPWFAELAILPTSDSIEKTIYNMWYSYAEKEIMRLGCNITYTTDKLCRLVRLENASKDVADKIRQIRRRIHVVVDLTAAGTAEIYFMSYKNNVPHIYLYDKPQQGAEPYIHFASCAFDVNNPATIADTTEQIKRAVMAYYDYNHHTVRPDTVKRPIIQI